MAYTVLVSCFSEFVLPCHKITFLRSRCPYDNSIGREGGHWRDLRTQFPGKYETGVDIKQGEWFHAKFVIKGKSLKVFVNGSDNPILTVDPMLDGVSKGSVGVWGWDSYFANFKYTPD